jgi:hypothetical protein
MTRFLSLLLLLKASTLTDASVAIAESTCTNFTFPEDDVVRELCFSAKIMGPSPWAIGLPNGTEYIEYIGVSSESYFFGNELNGLTTVVTWEGETDDCVATANGEDCLSCTICANGSVSADCTNLEYGRKVECGDNPLLYFDGCAVPYPFFPFLSTFEYKADSNATLPAAGEAPTTAGVTASGSASAAAYLQKGWLATVGTVMVLAVGSVLVLFELS